MSFRIKKAKKVNLQSSENAECNFENAAWRNYFWLFLKKNKNKNTRGEPI